MSHAAWLSWIVVGSLAAFFLAAPRRARAETCSEQIEAAIRKLGPREMGVLSDVWIEMSEAGVLNEPCDQDAVPAAIRRRLDAQRRMAHREQSRTHGVGPESLATDDEPSIGQSRARQVRMIVGELQRFLEARHAQALGLALQGYSSREIAMTINEDRHRAVAAHHIRDSIEACRDDDKIQSGSILMPVSADSQCEREFQRALERARRRAIAEGRFPGDNDRPTTAPVVRKWLSREIPRALERARESLELERERLAAESVTSERTITSAEDSSDSLFRPSSLNSEFSPRNNRSTWVAKLAALGAILCAVWILRGVAKPGEIQGKKPDKNAIGGNASRRNSIRPPHPQTEPLDEVHQVQEQPSNRVR